MSDNFGMIRYEGDPCPVCGAKLIRDGNGYLVCAKFLHYTATEPQLVCAASREPVVARDAAGAAPEETHP